jgi:hypothetical protein
LKKRQRANQNVLIADDDPNQSLLRPMHSLRLGDAPECVHNRELIVAEGDPRGDQGALASKLAVEELEALLFIPLQIFADLEVLCDPVHHL